MSQSALELKTRLMRETNMVFDTCELVIRMWIALYLKRPMDDVFAGDKPANPPKPKFFKEGDVQYRLVAGLFDAPPLLRSNIPQSQEARQFIDVVLMHLPQVYKTIVASLRSKDDQKYLAGFIPVIDNETLSYRMMYLHPIIQEKKNREILLKRLPKGSPDIAIIRKEAPAIDAEIAKMDLEGLSMRMTASMEKKYFSLSITKIERSDVSDKEIMARLPELSDKGEILSILTSGFKNGIRMEEAEAEAEAGAEDGEDVEDIEEVEADVDKEDKKDEL